MYILLAFIGLVLAVGYRKLPRPIYQALRVGRSTLYLLLTLTSAKRKRS